MRGRITLIEVESTRGVSRWHYDRFGKRIEKMDHVTYVPESTPSLGPLLRACGFSGPTWGCWEYDRFGKRTARIHGEREQINPPTPTPGRSRGRWCLAQGRRDVVTHRISPVIRHRNRCTQAVQ